MSASKWSSEKVPLRMSLCGILPLISWISLSMWLLDVPWNMIFPVESSYSVAPAAHMSMAQP